MHFQPADVQRSLCLLQARASLQRTHCSARPVKQALAGYSHRWCEHSSLRRFVWLVAWGLGCPEHTHPEGLAQHPNNIWYMSGYSEGHRLARVRWLRPSQDATEVCGIQVEIKEAHILDHLKSEGAGLRLAPLCIFWNLENTRQSSGHWLQWTY